MKGSTSPFSLLMRLSKVPRNHLNVHFDNSTANLDRELHGHDTIAYKRVVAGFDPFNFFFFSKINENATSKQ